MSNEEYFAELQDRVNLLYEIAREARAKGYDPVGEVEVKLAATLAAKAVGLISTIYPQIDKQEIVNRIMELEKEYGQLAPEISFKIAEEIARQKFCSFSSQLEAIDAGIRIGFAYSTLGVVSSPIEGYTALKTNKNEDGGEYFVPYFSGPIRSAGTTASCVVLILIDYLREAFGYAKYKPTEREIKRTIAEIYDYHERITNLQYLPTEEEAEFLARHLPIQVSGEPTEDREVSNYKDLKRVETNFIRGGFCLILGEGLAQKAQKGLRILRKLQKSGFKISEWEFLEEYTSLHRKRDEGKKELSPTYIKDLVAGRPIFGHPSASGSFRFRYGRSRFGGFSAASIHPATMAIAAGFISIGTQLKVEKPIKGCAVTVCDSIEGPIVKLYNGSVRRVNNIEEAKNCYKDVEEIIYLGDILFSFGDVLNRNQPLLKQGYVEEWWALEAKKAVPALNIDSSKVSFDEAAKMSEEYNIPLHPKYIYYWTQIDYSLFCSLLYWLENSYIEKKIILPYSLPQKQQFAEGKRALELLGVPHEVATENVVLKEEESKALLYNLGILQDILENNQYSLKEDIAHLKLKVNPSMQVLDIINKLAFVPIKDRAGTFIGARMGRPEKAKLRKLVGSPSVLFPVGEEGGRFRSVNEASEKGTIKGDFPIYYCNNCRRDTIYARCEGCDKNTEQRHYCRDCREIIYSKKCGKEGHNNITSYLNRRIDSTNYLAAAAKKLGMSGKDIPHLIKGVRGTSNKNHSMENLAKGILRAKHNLSVNKDGTVRYDATELPVTHFKPKEIGVSSKRLKEMGYEKDICGKELTSDEQILEIKPHDIILPSCPESKDEKSEEVFLNIAGFIDELLVKMYGAKPFYNIERKDQLVGQLVACMSPHNCAGVLGRIIGFSKTQGLLASPFIHAAMRRDCFDYNTKLPIYNGQQWNNIKIGELVEKLNPINIVDNYGTKEIKVENYKTVGFDNENNLSIVSINNFTKHSPSRTIKIKTATGKEITTTENHKFLVKENTIKTAFASGLKIGDLLILPRLRPLFNRNNCRVNFLESFSKINDIAINDINKKGGKDMGLKQDTNFIYDPIIEISAEKEQITYCLNVENHVVLANGILTRQCDGDEAAVMLLLDVLLNFSREFLPAHRGGTQDAPLVLNSRLRAGEVDEQILDFEVGMEYPLQLYELSEKGAHSSEVQVKTIRDVLKKGEDAFSNIGYTHETDDINKGLLNSSYKFLPTMRDKVNKQMELDKKIRAVDESDVARLIIERHFIRDIRGNLRKFSQQTFRCVGCNEIYRRPPLVGKCLKCGGRIIFTVSHGSIVKYLEPALELATKYNVSPYIRQSLFLAKSYIESIFGKEKDKQVELKKWF
ncbi:DNA polymerase II large subunit [Candidatus Pacearchaeota archaeon]|nr:DNA polymerase II large subunit [Candidatus Pacearchaeota archaeon]